MPRAQVQRTIHRLKTWPVYFQKVMHDIKRFEIRKNDRAFKEGDILVLDEWNPRSKTYTDADPIARVVTDILDSEEMGLKPGYVAMAIDDFADESNAKLAIELAPPRPTSASPEKGNPST